MPDHTPHRGLRARRRVGALGAVRTALDHIDHIEVFDAGCRSSRCFDISGASTDNGGNLIPWTRDTATNQRFKRRS
ncbi:hypothetical protein [Streptomyces sp. NBC_00582]|uniref:hypothetical protein n=1 Tax=Streptomyces sp. NBC_00582 TaxID=2975783 RepID=UPI002E8122AE|nr:hypothetical protein [Streptomyces sp. NBC_00582]WUB67289.1 hypothetical protein OG852_46260 [Streptomyces sp. NBC_00582]